MSRRGYTYQWLRDVAPISCWPPSQTTWRYHSIHRWPFTPDSQLDLLEQQERTWKRESLVSRQPGMWNRRTKQNPAAWRRGGLEISWDKEMRWLQERKKRIFIIIVVILCVAYVCWENVCMRRSNDNFEEFVVSFYIYTGSRSQAKVVRLVWQAFYPPSCILGKNRLKTRWPVSCICGSNPNGWDCGVSGNTSRCWGKKVTHGDICACPRAEL